MMDKGIGEKVCYPCPGCHSPVEAIFTKNGRIMLFCNGSENGPGCGTRVTFGAHLSATEKAKYQLVGNRLHHMIEVKDNGSDTAEGDGNGTIEPEIDNGSGAESTAAGNDDQPGTGERKRRWGFA